MVDRSSNLSSTVSFSSTWTCTTRPSSISTRRHATSRSWYS
jgi:hypothetical protein